ncbi:CoA ester lyase [bacterium]|nr:CoA ester lyase [bacterium]MDA9754022.1 CoA ester lyase [bacterium]MEC7925257.1 CoA ester lyase [Thermodesulfobacteriota bacterium]NSW96717.1 CoA ester lyase [bacterium]GIR28917.1 MAG: CoA ester lyase [bacterium]|tara:strand:+ start:6909 stop:7940 length:1032 start_codon:yes stop_codon:yes gene_type:complete
MFVLDGGTRVVVPRTELTYPGHNMKLHTNAASAEKTPVDHVMADLEDACPYEFKGDKSRATMVEALNTLDFGKKVITVRPNNIRSEFFRGDMEAILSGAVDKFHGIIIPKCNGPEDVKLVSDTLDELEKKNGWKTKLAIEALIERPGALESALDMAKASPRMAGLIFGIADYTAELGVDPSACLDIQNEVFYYEKKAVITAAKAAGLHAIDNVYLGLWRKDDTPERIKEVEDGLRKKVQGSALIGMDGTWVIHPQQAVISNEAFTPNEEQVKAAKHQLDFYHEMGGGSMFDPETGEMIDEATAKIALMRVSKAYLAGLVDKDYLDSMAEKSKSITGYDILGNN